MIVCDGAEHRTTEWVFSGCCGAGCDDGPSRAAASPAAALGGTGMSGGLRSASCVDTPLLAHGTEPSDPSGAHWAFSLWDADARNLPPPLTTPDVPLLRPPAPQWRFPSTDDFSTVLLI